MRMQRLSFADRVAAIPEDEDLGGSDASDGECGSERLNGTKTWILIYIECILMTWQMTMSLMQFCEQSITQTWAQCPGAARLAPPPLFPTPTLSPIYIDRDVPYVCVSGR